MIGFGAGFAIGAWLNHDFDWGGHRVFYHGWSGDGGWVRRSRPYVQINNVYVNRTYINVNFNRTIVNRTVNYGSLNRYNAVHREVRYDDVRVRSGPVGVSGRPGDRFPSGGGRGDQGRDNRGAYNKIIDRNINTRDPRLDVYRGRAPITPMPQRGEDGRSDRNRTNQRPRTGPAYQPLPPRTERPNPSVYGGSRGPIDPGAASRRGQNSRMEMNRPSGPPPSRGGGGGRQGGSRGSGRPSGGGKPGGGRPR
jgi:hypothetical protein